ncbi:MAG: hypothetical protein NT163_11040 [Chlorobiales bacterium]|nr:hypothetical protein [Chlorobiales bacterium]
MVIRKSKSKNALDPEHSFGLPLSQTYYEAACALLEQIETKISKPVTDKRYKDLLRVSAQSALLPALFLVRHTIELMLKEVLCLKDIAQKGKKAKIRMEHNLLNLWDELRKAACDDFAEEFKENIVTLSTILECIEQPINELHSVDEPGTNFRYPEALEANRLFPINISEVRSQLDVIIELLGELEKAYMATIDYNDQKD